MKIIISKATVLEVLETHDKVQKLKIVYSDGKTSKAIAYLDHTNPLSSGDILLANRIASELALGTGGYDFVICNMSNPELERNKGPGHIIKMPYTPLQSAVLSVEEKESEHHNMFDRPQTIDNMPVIVCGLHSHLAPATAMIKFIRPNTVISCIITDGAALPVYLSDTLTNMRSSLIDSVISCGNAFGGDLESVNIFSALIAAKHVRKSDITLVSMGPGIKGTETLYGHSGIEQGWIIDAINSLQGIAVFSPRISFADKRARHRGISHHSLTVLRDIAKTPCRIAFPDIEDPVKLDQVKEQIAENGLSDKHSVIFKEAGGLDEALANYGLEAYSMGRNLYDDPYFFKAAASAALVALEAM